MLALNDSAVLAKLAVSTQSWSAHEVGSLRMYHVKNLPKALEQIALMWGFGAHIRPRHNGHEHNS